MPEKWRASHSVKGFGLDPEGIGEPAESFVAGKDVTSDLSLIQFIPRAEWRRARKQES